MIIDDHNHAYYHGTNCASMLENMDRYHIDKTWLLAWEVPENEWDPETSWAFTRATKDAAVPLTACLEYMEKAPDRFILGYAPDPRDPYALNRLKAAQKSYGVKVCGEVKLRMMYDNPDALRLYRLAGELGMPVLMHFDYEYEKGRMFPRPSWWYGGDIDTLERVLRACPETSFIAHAPGFWAHISGDELYKTQQYPEGPVLPGGRITELLRKYPNLYCDMSAGSGCRALSRDLSFTERFLTEFSTRVLYGRDKFDNTHQELIERLNLSKEVKEAIYCKNALRLIGESET